MPEYFLEMNAHRSEIGSPKSTINHAEEVWFVGSHSDVYVIRQTMERINLMPSHPVVGLSAHLIKCIRILKTILSLTLFMLATCRFYG